MVTVEDLGEPETDHEFIFKVFIKIARSETWRERLDDWKTDTILQFVDIVEYDNLTHEQVVYCARRFSADTHWNRRKNMNRRSCASHAYSIYWLYKEGEEDRPLYVGLTQNIGRRWAAHRVGGQQTRGLSDLADLRIKVVETVCGRKQDADASESLHIQRAAAINPNLLNKRGR